MDVGETPHHPGSIPLFSKSCFMNGFFIMQNVNYHRKNVPDEGWALKPANKTQRASFMNERNANLLTS